MLFVFIWLHERRLLTTDQRGGSQPLLQGMQVQAVESIQIRRTNAFILQVQLTNGGGMQWQRIAHLRHQPHRLIRLV